MVHKSEPTTVLRQAHKSEPNHKALREPYQTLNPKPQSFARTRKSTEAPRWAERAVQTQSNALITFKTHGPRPSRSAESARRAAGWGRGHARGLDASLQTPVGDASLGARAKGRCGMGRYAGLAPSQHGLVGV